MAVKRPPVSAPADTSARIEFGARAEVANPRPQHGTSGHGSLVFRHIRLHSEKGPQHLQEGLQDLGAEIAFAAAAQQREGSPFELAQHFLQQPRLAQTRAADDERTPPRGRVGRAQKIGQKSGDFSAADEGRQAAAGGCVEAPGGRAASEHRTDLRQPGLRTGIGGPFAELEEICIWSESFKAGENLVGSGMLGQMGRRVDYIPDQIKPAPFDVARGQQQSTGMDARMHSQRQMTRRQAFVPQLPGPFMDVEGGLRSTPAVVLA